MKDGEPILLRTENPAFDLRPGHRLRLLNVHARMPNEEEDAENGHHVIVATMGSRSEVFLLSK